MSVDPRAGSNNTGAGLPEEAAEGGYHFLYKFMVSITIHGENLVFEYKDKRGKALSRISTLMYNCFAARHCQAVCSLLEIRHVKSRHCFSYLYTQS